MARAGVTLGARLRMEGGKMWFRKPEPGMESIACAYFALHAVGFALVLALSGCQGTPKPAPAAPPKPPKPIIRTIVKQACFKPQDYSTEQEARFADEDEALKASGKFPMTIMRIVDYGRERKALKACVDAQN